MKRLLLFPLLALLCMQACKKDDPADNEPDPPTIDKPADYFFPMKVGNYWVYETVNSVNSSVMIDTMKVIRDTTINGMVYYEFNKFTLGILNESVWPAIVTDSAGYLLNTTGNLLLLNDGTRDTIALQDFGIVNTVIKTGATDTLINITAGSFTCLETITDAYYVPASGSPTGTNPRYMHEYWSKNIGLVKRTYFFASDARFYTVTLKSYHLEL